MKFINIGFGNMLASHRVLLVVSPESAPIKRLVSEQKEKGTLIDISCGRRTKSVILTDSDHVILSALSPETISYRLNTEDEEDEKTGGEDNGTYEG